MAGVTGREVKAAYAQCNTWGVPASVTAQINILSTDGLDQQWGLIDDESFNQTFQGDADIGDHAAVVAELGGQLRYDGFDVWLAAGMGSVAAPVAVSSQGAATSLVAYQHVITLAPEITDYFTLAVDEAQYIREVTSMKIKGYTVKVGQNGVMDVMFQVVGNKITLTSAVNTNSTVAGAAVMALANRVLRKHGVFRMNLQSAGALAATDSNSVVKEWSIGTTRPMAEDDIAFGGDAILEPEDDGMVEFPIEVTYARMNTVSANSLAIAFQAGTKFKADVTFTGAFVNSTTARSMLWQFPNLQCYAFSAPITGHNQVRPTAKFRAKLAASSPAGMAFVSPVRLTIMNTNSATLLA